MRKMTELGAESRATSGLSRVRMASAPQESMVMLTVWGRRSSFNLQKVMWLVGELELPHKHIPAEGDFRLNDTPEFLAMNPHGRVPVIDDNGTIVWESQTILRYLAAKYGRERLRPPSREPAAALECTRPAGGRT